MEKPNKSLFLKFLPKAYSAVHFQNPSFSPGRDHHHNHNHHRSGFSGPINFAGLPDEAREKPKNGTYYSQEPTSPKVSCMGQIKHKHKKKKLMKSATSNNNNNNNDHHNDKENNIKIKQVKKSGSAISKLFSKKSKGPATREHGKDGKPAAEDHKVGPTLGNMRKFASGRESLANFDWTAQIAPIDHQGRDCYSDEERGRDSGDEDDEEREVIIPYSAPMLLGGGGAGGGGGLSLEPRKEVNLWKRRTMAPPPPLAL